MRVLSLLCCTVLLSFGSILAATPEQSAIRSQASQAFSAGKSITSVEMTGTVQWTVGSTKDSGPAKLTANVTGENRAEFDLSNGTRVEAQSAITDDRTCTWSGKDGVVHDVASSNCWTATAWFLPHLTLQSEGQPTALQTTTSTVANTTSASSPVLQNSLHIAPGKTSTAVTSLIQSWS